jgi:hypothetical protein
VIVVLARTHKFDEQDQSQQKGLHGFVLSRDDNRMKILSINLTARFVLISLFVTKHRQKLGVAFWVGPFPIP